MQPLLNQKESIPLILSGDQQTLIRAEFFMQQYLPSHVRGLVVLLPGHFHFFYHFQIAIFSLYEEPLFNVIREKLNLGPLQPVHFHRCERFMFMITIASLIFFSKHKTDSNPLLLLIKSFLDEAALPYWRGRSALRAGHVDIVERVWAHAYFLFLATGKKNYAHLTISYLSHKLGLEINLLHWVRQYETLSLSGVAGHRVATDILIEHVNRQAKTMIRSTNDKEQALKRIPELNVTSAFSRDFEEVWKNAEHLDQQINEVEEEEEAEEDEEVLDKKIVLDKCFITTTVEMIGVFENLFLLDISKITGFDPRRKMDKPMTLINHARLVSKSFFIFHKLFRIWPRLIWKWNTSLKNMFLKMTMMTTIYKTTF